MKPCPAHAKQARILALSSERSRREGLASLLASIADRASIRSFSVGDWAGLNGLGGEAEELATRAYAPELLTLTLHRSGSAAFREGGQARYGFLSTLLRLPKELSLSGKRSLSNASCFQEARRKVTQLRHGVYAALLLAKANGRQLSGHRSRGRERPRAKRTPATYNNPQLLRPHRQVFPTRLPGPRSSAAHRRIQVKCNTNARESCAARENYWLSQQRKLLFPRPQSLSILPNSNSPFTLRASLKAFGQSAEGPID